ncbi:MAG: Nif3-like dinuclear metal center hexameric protein [Thermoclostridium sp.]|nr:Nif3-like dinuclear metal center hexameric protein [Thermoclostridium sp.]
MQCKEIIAFLEKEAPLFLQEDYDNSGLQWGNPDNEVQKILVCLDLTQEAVNTAIREKVQMILSHHPILFRPMKSIHTGFGTGAMLAQCIRENICVYAAHTNFDVARNGLNNYLAAALELQEIEGLKPQYREALYKLVVFIPEKSLEQVQKAIFEAGAGWIGKYSDCGFSVEGKGTFKPGDGTNPYIGQKGELEAVREYRLETIVPHERLDKVIESMLKAHPYEEVAYDVYRLEQPMVEYSLGKVGILKDKLSAAAFIDYVKEKLQVSNVRIIGGINPHSISRVAVFCGSFDGDAKAVKARKPDALVTGDLKYHDAQDLLQAGIFTVDAGHYHTEKLFIQGISDVLKKQFKDVIIFEHYGQDIFEYR